MTEAERTALGHVARRLRAKWMPVPTDIIRDIRMLNVPYGGFRMDALSRIAAESLNSKNMSRWSVY
jgi:hypothetical protein